MTAKEILAELKPLGRESYKQLLFTNYGVKEPCFGVAVSELKKFQKRIQQELPTKSALPLSRVTDRFPA